MKGRHVVSWLSWFGVLLVLVFTAASVDARGGRGGGGGGRGGGGGGRGGGFSRSGPASSGSFRTPRPSTRPSYSRPTSRPSGQRPGMQPARPSTQPARPQQRPSTPSATRPGSPSATRPSRPDQGQRPAQQPDRTGNREDWQQNQGDRQQDRQDWADQAREDRQDYAKNAREDWQEYAEWDEGGGYWVGGWHGPVIYDDDDVEWGVFLAGAVIGTALTSAAYGSMRSETGCSPSEVVVDGITYMKCGSTWYNRVMQGGAVNYVVVAAPPGF